MNTCISMSADDRWAKRYVEEKWGKPDKLTRAYHRYSSSVILILIINKDSSEKHPSTPNGLNMSDPTLHTPHSTLSPRSPGDTRQEQSALDILDAIRDPLCYYHHYRTSYRKRRFTVKVIRHTHPPNVGLPSITLLYLAACSGAERIWSCSGVSQSPYHTWPHDYHPAINLAYKLHTLRPWRRVSEKSASRKLDIKCIEYSEH